MTYEESLEGLSNLAIDFGFSFQHPTFTGLDSESSFLSSQSSHRRQSNVSCLSSFGSNCSTIASTDPATPIECFESKDTVMEDFVAATSMDTYSYTDLFSCFGTGQMRLIADDHASFPLHDSSILKYGEEPLSLKNTSISSPARLSMQLQSKHAFQHGPTMAYITESSPSSDSSVSQRAPLYTYPDIISSERGCSPPTVEPGQICSLNSPPSSIDQSWNSTPTQWDDGEFDSITPHDHLPTTTGVSKSERLSQKYKHVIPHVPSITASSHFCTELLGNGSRCPKKFKRHEHLKRHVINVHSGEEPFECEYCIENKDPNAKGKPRFNRNDNKTQHIVNTHLEPANKKRNDFVSDERALQLGWGLYLKKRDMKRKKKARREQEKAGGTAVLPRLPLTNRPKKVNGRKRR